ncbi:DNA polymerase III epsilon subunit family exonuclease [Streptomyces sp. CZ24]|nr:DNA polymerase III epsilon subunit family exonuclease [Streptomyces sp. CZ24]
MLEDHTPASAWPATYPTGYAVVDVETTGLARDDRIVSAGVYQLDALGRVEDHWYTLVNPERDPGPVWIHGLTTSVLKDAPLFKDISDELSARLADRVLVAHNAAFDWSMLAREYARAERVAPVRQRLCTIALSKELGLPLPNHKLESLAAHFGVVQERAHHALDDARVLAEAFRPSLAAAAGGGVRLPLLECRPLTEWSEPPATPRIGRQPSYGGPFLLAPRPQAACLPLPEPGAVRARRAAGAGDADRLLRGHLDRAGPSGGPGHRGGAARGDQPLAADQPAGDQRPGVGDVQDGQGPPVRHAGGGRGRLRPAAPGRGARAGRLNRPPGHGTKGAGPP